MYTTMRNKCMIVISNVWCRLCKNDDAATRHKLSDGHQVKVEGACQHGDTLQYHRQLAVWLKKWDFQIWRRCCSTYPCILYLCAMYIIIMPEVRGVFVCVWKWKKSRKNSLSLFEVTRGNLEKWHCLFDRSLRYRRVPYVVHESESAGLLENRRNIIARRDQPRSPFIFSTGFVRSGIGTQLLCVVHVLMYLV